MKIALTLINKKGSQFIVTAKAPSKLALLVLFGKLLKYANKENKLVKLYCDDYQTLGLLASAVSSNVEVTAIEGET